MRRSLSAQDLARIAVVAGLIAALGLPGTIVVAGAVPVTAQTMGVMLAGSLLGARRGAAAVLLFLGLTALGLPLLAGGRGGLGVFVGPSAGYLVGWVLGAWVIGRLVEAGFPGYSRRRGLLAHCLGGILVVYAVGVPVQAWVTGTSTVLAAAVNAAAFLPGDLVKAVVAVLVADGVHRAMPSLAEPVLQDRRRGIPGPQAA